MSTDFEFFVSVILEVQFQLEVWYVDLGLEQNH